LLDDGVPLYDTTHVGSSWLGRVLLNMMDDILVDFTMKNGLHFSDFVVSDLLLDNGSTIAMLE
jgi:hypothetical protein